VCSVLFSLSPHPPDAILSHTFERCETICEGVKWKHTRRIHTFSRRRGLSPWRKRMFAWRRSAPKVPVSTLYRRKSCACTQPVCIFLENDLVCKKNSYICREQLACTQKHCICTEKTAKFVRINSVFAEHQYICTEQRWPLWATVYLPPQAVWAKNV
jgi:hypothetical protein